MPITVRGSFLVIAALIGFTGVGNVAQTVAWIVIVFVSILVHELGHAFTARMYGASVAIELNGLGGLTRWSVPDGQLSPGRRALVAAAGSATGLLFGGLVWLVASQGGPYWGLTSFVLVNTVRVNVFWGLLNWAPIRPLDGGHLLMSLLEKVAPRRATSIARAIFMTSAAAALVVAIRYELIFIAVLAGWMLLSELSFWTQPRSAPTGLPTLSYESPPTGQDEDEAGPVTTHDPEDPEETPR
jgi:stage IV sporulation protein FB